MAKYAEFWNIKDGATAQAMRDSLPTKPATEAWPHTPFPLDALMVLDDASKDVVRWESTDAHAYGLLAQSVRVLKPGGVLECRIHTFNGVVVLKGTKEALDG